MTEELNNPPFDPTPVEPQFFIRARGATATISRNGVYPESGQTFDGAALQGDSLCAPSLKGWWREMFGPSKAELRVKIGGLERENEELKSKEIALKKQIEILKKQVAIWGKTYTTVSELAQQRIQDIAFLREKLIAANQEIELLGMELEKRKPVRPKKAK